MTQKRPSPDDWIARAALCELLAKSLQTPVREWVFALTSGEFAEALQEIGEACGFAPDALREAASLLSGYWGQDAGELFHTLRTEYTRLLVGAPEPAVSAYAGVWFARKQGVKPLLFVSPRAMEIERFMRACGIGQAEGKNEPLDHLTTEFEFLQYVALANAGALCVAEGVELAPDTFEDFLSRYVADWAPDFARELAAATTAPFYEAVALIVRSAVVCI